jgi:hypothetical protein
MLIVLAVLGVLGFATAVLASAQPQGHGPGWCKHQDCTTTTAPTTTDSPPPPPPPGTIASWNPAVTRSFTRTTIPFIVGTGVNALGGATEAGGGFPNHAQQGQPSPSTINGSDSALVELDDVVVRAAEGGRKYWGAGDGDATIDLEDINSTADLEHRALHAEVSYGWANYLAPQVGAMDQTEFGNLPAGAHIDVQGLVMWDAFHTSAGFHYYSGWEIHPVTAWRPHSTTGATSWHYVTDPSLQDPAKFVEVPGE